MQLTLGADYVATGHYARVDYMTANIKCFAALMTIKIKRIS